MGTGAALGPAAVLAASGRAGEKSNGSGILLKGLLQHPKTTDLLYGIR